MKDPEFYAVTEDCMNGVERGGRKACHQMGYPRGEAAYRVFDGSIEAKHLEAQFVGHPFQNRRPLVPVGQIKAMGNLSQMPHCARYETEVFVIRDVLKIISEKEKGIRIDLERGSWSQAMIMIGKNAGSGFGFYIVDREIRESGHKAVAHSECTFQHELPARCEWRQVEVFGLCWIFLRFDQLDTGVPIIQKNLLFWAYLVAEVTGKIESVVTYEETFASSQ